MFRSAFYLCSFDIIIVESHRPIPTTLPATRIRRHANMKLTWVFTVLFAGIVTASPIIGEEMTPARRDNAMALDNRCQSKETQCGSGKDCADGCFCDAVRNICVNK
ncbi:hypothetical protein I7I53_11256 [Histoplasma capsulatum var. duboisii H88]|uniref:Uncharacterized protein n=1 Tax=Ajellomyces capsulatus (strain H88) TaxID=544711 RepID=A0A8A1LA68_AJEC8|nr:hypothetical protein I7I53_11256 [Histoplasma capsulatum var. duboisii H88]